jgi:hypothetical protein
LVSSVVVVNVFAHCFFPLSLADEEEYELDYQRPENNVHNLVCVKGLEIKLKGGEVVDALTLYCPIVDIRDYKKKKYSASLLPDGSGIRLMVPTSPRFLFDHVSEIHALEKEDECEKTKLRHAVASKDIKKNKRRQTKYLMLRFPGRVVCHNKHFNGTRTDMKLKGRYRMVQVDIDEVDDKQNPVYVAQPYLVFKMVIDGVKRSVESEDDETDSEDGGGYQEAMKRMTIAEEEEEEENDDMFT